MHKVLVLAFLGLVVLSVVLFLQGAGKEPARETHFVQRVVDGDTIVLADGSRLRLIGIDSPEKDQNCFVEAREFLHFLVSGKAVELELGLEKRDKYGRLLAYVFVEGEMANLAAVSKGFAVAYPFEPNTKYATEFSVAEQSVREKGIGCLWEQKN